MTTVPAPGGLVTLIHKAEALGRVLGAFDQRFGALRILPLQPRVGAAAHRVIVQGTKGSRAPLQVLPGFVLHEAGNGFTPAAQDILRHGGPLLCHPSVMYRRELVLAQGGYHAAFRHCEDLDLWLRMASVTQLANIPERLIHYRHYMGQVSKRHATEQQVGAAIAYEAWRMRDEGKADPTAHVDRLPAIEELDAFFGEEGVARRVRRAVTGGILHSPIALRDQGFEILLRHIKDGGSHEGMWRTVGRLVKLGEPLRALRLSAALAAS